MPSTRHNDTPNKHEREELTRRVANSNVLIKNPTTSNTSGRVLVGKRGMVFPNRLLSLHVTHDPRTLQIRNIDICGTAAVMSNAVARRKVLKLLVDCPQGTGMGTRMFGEENMPCSACDTLIPRFERHRFQPSPTDVLQTSATFGLDQDTRSHTEANVDAGSGSGPPIAEPEPNPAWEGHKLPVLFPELRLAAGEVEGDEMLDLFRKLVVAHRYIYIYGGILHGALNLLYLMYRRDSQGKAIPVLVEWDFR